MDTSAIQVRLLLEGGHTQDVVLDSGAPELSQLFQVLGGRTSGSEQEPEQFFQLPLEGGKESFSFSSRQLVAINTQPPVVIEFERAVQASVTSPFVADQIQRPLSMVMDDFLGHYEHQDMLAHALQQQEKFDAGTVLTGVQTARQNLVILDFAQHAHSTLLANRLLTWLPQILQSLGIPSFPVDHVESQLTASNDGHYYRAHIDTDESTGLNRAITCVYYFSKQPAQFTGGGLRIYDSLYRDGQRYQAESFKQVQPISNRMVVFPSDSFHELLPIRCPSRKFEDSRFAVTNWVWRSREPKPEAVHGWGHMHCAKAPSPEFSDSGEPQ